MNATCKNCRNKECVYVYLCIHSAAVYQNYRLVCANVLTCVCKWAALRQVSSEFAAASHTHRSAGRNNHSMLMEFMNHICTICMYVCLPSGMNSTNMILQCTYIHTYVKRKQVILPHSSILKSTISYKAQSSFISVIYITPNSILVWSAAHTHWHLHIRTCTLKC